MLYADFLAAVQVIVYVGGILVLIIFGVMHSWKNQVSIYRHLISYIIFILNGNWVNVDFPTENTSLEIGRLIL